MASSSAITSVSEPLQFSGQSSSVRDGLGPRAWYVGRGSWVRRPLPLPPGRFEVNTDSMNVLIKPTHTSDANVLRNHTRTKTHTSMFQCACTNTRMFQCACVTTHKHTHIRFSDAMLWPRYCIERHEEDN